MFCVVYNTMFMNINIMVTIYSRVFQSITDIF